MSFSIGSLEDRLSPWGWDQRWHEVFVQVTRELSGIDPPPQPGRVVAVHRNLLSLETGHGVFKAHLSGRCRHRLSDESDKPATGDWVIWQGTGADETLTVSHILQRRSVLARKAPGGGTQVLCANVDTVWLVSSLNRDWNPARLERYLAMAWDGNCKPVVVLTKADLHPNPAEVEAEVENLAFGTPVHAVSVLHHEGLDALADYLRPGRTIALLGSSGVGKSTLANAFLGAGKRAVGGIRAADDKGRHTTTARELVGMDSGAMLLDTPGLRELALAGDEGGLQTVFADIEAIAARCRFRDCAHQSEPGCAVRQAVSDGTVQKRRLRNYHKMQLEAERAEERSSVQGALKRKQRDKALHKLIRKTPNR